MTQAVAQVRNVVSRSGFANPLTLGVLVADADYVKVYADDELLDDGPDYEITGIGDPNGVSIEIIGAEDPDNYVGYLTFTALFDPPLDQQGDLSAGGVLGRSFETALDQQNRRMQALADKVGRALRLTPNMDIDGELPWPPTDAFALVWDADLQRVVWADPTGSSVYAEQAAASAAEAAADAAAALASAAAAASAAGDAAAAQTAAEAAQAAAELAQAAAEAAAASAANKLPLDGSAPMTGPIGFTHQASPSNPPSGVLALFAKADNKFYSRASDGTETEIGSGAAIGFSFDVREYGAVFDDVTDDAAAIQAAIDDAAAAGGGVVEMPVGHGVIGTQLTVPAGVLLKGQGHGTQVDTGITANHATSLRWSGSAGGTMVLASQVEGALLKRVGGGGVVGVALLGEGDAAIGVDGRGLVAAQIDVYGQEFTTAIADIGPCDTLDDVRNFEHSSVIVHGVQVGTLDGNVLRITGNQDRNTCYNDFYVYGLYKNGDGLDVGDTDNNLFHQVWLFRFGGGTGKGVRLRAHATHPARANRFEMVYPGDGGVVAEGTDTAATATYDNQIDFLDRDNAVADPVIGVGAVLNWKGTDEPSRYPIPAPQGRLTLTNLEPAGTTGVTAGTTIYYFPWVGDCMPLWDGGQFRPYQFQNDNLILDSNSGHTGYHQSGKNFDLFAIWNDGLNNIVLCSGPAWSSDTARGTGAGTTELEKLHGIWVNKNSITLRYGNGSSDTVVTAARRATYLGSFRASADGQVTHAFGSAASAGGTAANMLLWNCYHRRLASAVVRDSNDSWTYTTANTWRASDNSNGMRVNFLAGLNEDLVEATFTQLIGGSGVQAAVGVGLDSVTAPTRLTVGVLSGGTAMGRGHAKVYPGLGFHFFNALEISGGSTATFYGDNGGAVQLSGLIVDHWC